MEKMKFAIIGYGGMGSHHKSALISKESDIMEVVSSYDIKSDRQEAAQKDGLYIYDHLEDLLADDEIEAVLIATPNELHKELSIKALRHGKHVVCEKPVTMNVQELDEIVKVSEKEDRVFMVHQNRRWDPDFLLVNDLFKDKKLGDIYHIESRVHGANGIPGDWRHKKAHGGGMLFDWGVHLIDQILWLIDRPITDIKVDLSYILGDEVDDGFMIYLTFENNIRVLLEVATTNFIKLPRWYVKGTEGTARIDDWDLSGKMVVSTGLDSIEKPSPIKAGAGLTKTMAPPVEGMTEELELPRPRTDYISFYQNFYEVVREGAEPIIKNEQVRKVMELIDEIFSMYRDI